MNHASPTLFDFAPYVGKSAGYLALLKEFAAGSAFRSAAIGELVLPSGDFDRRPLRPEDFDFLKFTKPVQARTVSRLPALASQRCLSSLYELSSAVPPARSDATRRAAFAEFASDRNRWLGAQLMPFLEAYAFEHVNEGLPALESSANCYHRIAAIYTDQYAFWTRLFSEMAAADYLHEALRLVYIQQWCLARSKQVVLATAAAHGHFDAWPTDSAPRLEPALLTKDDLRRIALKVGVEREPHAYWQFYLATSLAKSNVLYALSRRCEQPFAFYGALYAAQAESLAFEAAQVDACPALLAEVGVTAGDSRQLLAQWLPRLEAGLNGILQCHGEAAITHVAQGAAACGTLAERSRWDLGEQLTWLSAIDRYCHYARLISRRIDLECPSIDRDTFVEPRDMCSTTHVHNDHRLVTIESGVMQFWGNLGMRLEMQPGDRVLIPEGRLHGSTVTSLECTYHQPIIPDEWVRELLAATSQPANQRSAEHLSESIRPVVISQAAN